MPADQEPVAQKPVAQKPVARQPWTSLRRRVTDTAAFLTTPLLPEDFTELVNPLWASRDLRGRVEAVRRETADATTIVIRPGRGWPGHRAGQYVDVGVEVDGVRHWRSYSLSSPPQRLGGSITITVKAVATGLVSRHLARDLRPGAVVRLRRPQGEFVLPDAVPPRLLFLTAGSGITPVAAMLRDLMRAGDLPDVLLVHSAPTPADVIFGPELRALAARAPGLRLHERHTRCPTGANQGRLDLAKLPDICPDWRERHVWACGPTAMLDDVERYWHAAGLGDRLRVERFRPARAVGGTGGRVRFTRSAKEVDAPGGTPLLEVGEEAGVLMPSGCRMGICYSCVARLTSGRVRDVRTGQEHDDDYVQTCVSAAAGAVEIDL